MVSMSVTDISVLKYLGFISKGEPSNVIDRSKMRRERKRLCTALIDTEIENRNKVLWKNVPETYFNGRKDKTRTTEKKDQAITHEP